MIRIIIPNSIAVQTSTMIGAVLIMVVVICCHVALGILMDLTIALNCELPSLPQHQDYISPGPPHGGVGPPRSGPGTSRDGSGPPRDDRGGAAPPCTSFNAPHSQ